METNGPLSQKTYGMWLQIQQNTFTNWVNECLRGRGIAIEDLRTGLSDGVNLIALIEALSRRHILGSVDNPTTLYQKLENITLALDTVKQDGVKIVNIDSSDIFESNLKLVLGLVWQLILKYQVGLSGSQHKSWILRWLQEVIPECNVSNLTTDLNDGVVLHALLDFCKPGLSPGWRTLDRKDKVENCRTAMKLARQHFNVPLILRPEDMSSPELDERSSITYLSYYIKLGGPGYVASLEQVTARTKPLTVSNFTTDWQDGQALSNLVRSAGGRVGDGQGLDALRKALEGGERLGVQPLLTPEEILIETSEHMGMMAYSVQFLRFPNYIYYTTISSPLTDSHLSVSNTNINMVSFTPIPENNTRPGKQVTTELRDDLSTHTSTIVSPGRQYSSQHATFDLVTKSMSNVARIEAPPPEQLKIDVYSTGVIMESKVRGDFVPEKFKVEAVSPNGRVIKISGDGEYAAQFSATEIGKWHVSMSYDDVIMDKSPVEVCDPSQVLIRDLKGGFAGKNNTFHVDCTRAGPGDVGVDITTQGRLIPSSVTKAGTPGLYKVRFTPYTKGPHEINVHFNRAEVRDADFYTFDQEERQRKALFNTEIIPQPGYVEVKASCDWKIDYITGGPFVCHVTDSLDIPVYRMQDGTVCGRPELIVDCSRVGEGRVDADVTFNGLRYPCKVRQERDRPNVYRVRFRPKGPGIYKVWITLDGTAIKGSPFIQEIAELEGPSAFGDGLYRGILGQPVSFTINPKGHPGQVAVTVDGPSKPVHSTLEMQNDLTIIATYTPMERGPHKVNILMDNKHIKGSPYSALIVDPVKVRISGGWRPLLDDTGVIPLKVRKEKVLPFDVSEAGPGELTADVQGPNGKIPVAIDARNDGKHSVVFTPREPGKHYIHVNWVGYPLANSPYLGEATVEPDEDEYYPNVRLVPVQLRSPTSSIPSSVISGPPPLTYTVNNIDQPDSGPYRPNGYVVYQQPVEPTRIQVISPQPQTSPYSSPIKLYQYGPVSPRYQGPASPPLSTPTSSARPTPKGSLRAPQKVILTGKGLREAVVQQPAHFQVDGSKSGPGQPSAFLESVRNRIPVSHEPVAPNVYRCSYVPLQPGAYLLYINWNDKPLRGSPFKVNIRDPFNPNKVVVNTDPKGGVVGRDYDITIDPRDAGIGQLTATCTDPVGKDVPVRLSDNYDGTNSVKVKPTMPGRHIVEVRYNGTHVKGSPFAIDINVAAPKGSVKVWGPGIEDGVLPAFQSHFWVETTGAGAGDLRVRIIGPKGAFKVKMRKASEKDKIYQCFYDPIGEGVYTIHVQWSGVHVSGSPYTILLGETALDLMRMQSELSRTPLYDLSPSAGDPNNNHLASNGSTITSTRGGSVSSTTDGDRKKGSSKKKQKGSRQSSKLSKKSSKKDNGTHVLY